MHLSCLLLVKQVLVWGQVTQGLVRTDVIVDLFPSPQGLIQGHDLEVAIKEFVELLGMGALGSLHMTIELGRPWRQHE